MSKQEHPQPFDGSSFLPLPCSTHSEWRPSLGTDAQTPEHQLVLPGGSGSPATAPVGQHGHVPQLPPLLVPSLFLLLPTCARMRACSWYRTPASGNNSFVLSRRIRLIWSMLGFEMVREHEAEPYGLQQKEPRPGVENHSVFKPTAEREGKKKLKKREVSLKPPLLKSEGQCVSPSWSFVNLSSFAS